MAQPNITLTTYATGFDGPVDIANAGDDRLFVVEQQGVIRVVQAGGSVNATPFLDIQSIVDDSGNEQGLLGLAFHPDYATNGYFYVHYTDNGGDTQISRFSVSGADPDIADGASEFQILNVSQPYSNHNGGAIKFGPDNYLYISLGDGGSAGDPGNRAQDSLNLLGKMLRIDVDGGTPYGIPADNPFVGNPAGADEIWATGLRNAWKFSFDRINGDMWIGDVGQDIWEEIDLELASSAGGENYGWRCYEASATYNTSGCDLTSSLYNWPVYEYNQSGAPPNGCSVTGGFRYRGTDFPNMQGYYLFSDVCGNWIYTLHWDGASWVETDHGTFTGAFSSFGEDYLGELYVCGLFTGIVYRIEDANVGLGELSSNAVTSVHPNPLQDMTTIYFKNPANQDHELVIYDLSGKRVYEQGQITGDQIPLDASAFPSGFYMFELRRDGRSVGSGKLVIE